MPNNTGTLRAKWPGGHPDRWRQHQEKLSPGLALHPELCPGFPNWATKQNCLEVLISTQTSRPCSDTLEQLGGAEKGRTPGSACLRHFSGDSDVASLWEWPHQTTLQVVKCFSFKRKKSNVQKHTLDSSGCKSPSSQFLPLNWAVGVIPFTEAWYNRQVFKACWIHAEQIVENALLCISDFHPRILEKIPCLTFIIIT